MVGTPSDKVGCNSANIRASGSAWRKRSGKMRSVPAMNAV